MFSHVNNGTSHNLTHGFYRKCRAHFKARSKKWQKSKQRWKKWKSGSEVSGRASQSAEVKKEKRQLNRKSTRNETNRRGQESPALNQTSRVVRKRLMAEREQKQTLRKQAERPKKHRPKSQPKTNPCRQTPARNKVGEEGDNRRPWLHN